ncbi:hypothetical protein PR003_g9700 [Phytophthora rubi]|uniref:Uncharacterized protein n=1 Tax=Phytophthora rubi TaxID=129364 RepID=A0A6A3NVF2_9STRA|nr:hypothetical protein PR001_g3758 [Phytophthora rubi]KAE9342000.1 hypothetical protein PR003_g9700 [Phytophthora rubi]
MRLFVGGGPVDQHIHQDRAFKPSSRAVACMMPGERSSLHAGSHPEQLQVAEEQLHPRSVTEASSSQRRQRLRLDDCSLECTRVRRLQTNQSRAALFRPQRGEQRSPPLKKAATHTPLQYDACSAVMTTFDAPKSLCSSPTPLRAHPRRSKEGGRDLILKL